MGRAGEATCRKLCSTSAPEMIRVGAGLPSSSGFPGPRLAFYSGLGSTAANGAVWATVQSTFDFCCCRPMDFVRRTTLKIPYTARASYALSHRKGKYISPAIHPLESVPSLLSTRPSSHAQAAARVSAPLSLRSCSSLSLAAPLMFTWA
jgi:hypothetical protein